MAVSSLINILLPESRPEPLLKCKGKIVEDLYESNVKIALTESRVG